MATYNSPFKSGTFDGAPVSGATTFAVTGFTPGAGDVGRIIIINSGSAKLQHREITAVAGQNITVAHAWDTNPFVDTSLDGRATDVLPSSGDTVVISYDVDDLISGDAQMSLSVRNLSITGNVIAQNGAYLHFKNYDLEFSANNLLAGNNGGFIFGYYGYVENQDGFMKDSCNFRDTATNQNGCRVSTSSFGLWDMYGGNARFASNTAGQVFWRLYKEDAANTQVRIFDVFFYGNMGARVDGNRSMLVYTNVDSVSTTGLANPRSSVARVEFTALNCDQGGYVFTSEGPTGRAVFNRLVNVRVRLLRIVGANPAPNSIYEVIAKKSEVDSVPAFFNAASTLNNHLVRYGNLARPDYIDAAGQPVSGNIKTRLYDDTNAFITENSISDAQYVEEFLRHTDMPTISGNRTLANGTLFAPYSLRNVSYGKQFTTANISAEDTFEPSIVMLDDLLITEPSKIVTDAYTTLETAEKFYDRAVAWLQDNITDETAFLVSRSGSTIDAGPFNVVLDPAAATPFGFEGTTITIDPGTTFTGSITTTGDVTITAGFSTFDGEITAANITVADGVDITNKTLTGVVNFTTAANLTGVTLPGTVVYNDNVDKEITYDGVTANVVRNDGSGNITISLVNGATIADSSDAEITAQVATTPSSFTLTADSGDVWAIYDDANSLVTSGSDNIIYNNAASDTGTWSIVLHRLGHIAEIVTWVANDGSANTFTFSPTQLLRPEGGPVYSGGSTTGLVALRNGDDYLEVQVPNESVTTQQVVDAQQNFLHTAAGLDLIFDTGRTSAPVWGTLSGITFMLSIEGYQYDSTSGSTPESSVSSILVSSATHLNVRTDNAGTNFAATSTVDPTSLAQAVWDYLVANAITPGSTGAALTTINDGIKAASILVPHGDNLTV